MAVYVFITGKLGKDANAICTYNVAKELSNNKNKIIFIGEGNKGQGYYQDFEIYEIKPDILSYFSERMKKTKKTKDKLIFKFVVTIRRIVKSFIFFSFPNVSPIRSWQVYRALKKIGKKTKIDYIVGAFKPYEGIWASQKYKKRNPKVCSIAIYWDLLRGVNPFGKMFVKLFNDLCYKSERKVFGTFDRILIPKSGMTFYKGDNYKDYQSKISYFEFPVFDEIKKTISLNKVKDNTLVLNCIGSIDGKNRSVKYFLEIVDTIIEMKKINIHVNFIGSFSEMNIYEKYKNKDYISFLGTVEFDKVNQFYNNADFLVNISNRLTCDMIPSKIFQYFASCKPIINFVSNKDDKSLEYFKKYGFCLNILEYNHDLRNDAVALEDYIKGKQKNLPDFSDVEKIFYENKPSYFAKEFLN